MQYLSPMTTRHHEQNTIFMSKNLTTCSHFFLRTDSSNKGLQYLYEGPYKVIDRTEMMFRILRHGKELSVSFDRLKLACVLKELMEISAGKNKEKKMSSQSEEVPYIG
ncbi:uncharacterized protein NPIL_671791 [Nephila pilipes]|uniref:Uncharacterized protein n=1 Tax=Nephila pilipes TaxID=299642 RepID=A0A8X6NU82_NEPPI|nr:uncharacterized protein NPIL_671791 [Nephila pilipes]